MVCGGTRSLWRGTLTAPAPVTRAACWLGFKRREKGGKPQKKRKKRLQSLPHQYANRRDYTACRPRFVLSSNFSFPFSPSQRQRKISREDFASCLLNITVTLLTLPFFFMPCHLLNHSFLFILAGHVHRCVVLARCDRAFAVRALLSRHCPLHVLGRRRRVGGALAPARALRLGPGAHLGPALH